MSFSIILQCAGGLLTCIIFTKVIEHQRSHKNTISSYKVDYTQAPLITDWYTLLQQWLNLEIEPFSKYFAHEIEFSLHTTYITGSNKCTSSLVQTFFNL